MEPTNRSNVGNSTGGQNLPPSNGTQQPGYDPIFSPTGRAGVQSTPTTPTIISGPTTPPPDPNHTTSTATGDIVLSKSPNKSKLPLIIGLIVAIVLVIAGLIVLIANPFGKSTSNSSSVTTSFNKFVNYLYDGSDATGYNADAYADDATYNFEEVFTFSNQSIKSEYFATAQQLFASYQSIQNEAVQSVSTLNAQIGAELDFLTDLTTTDILTSEDITNYYLKSSPQQTKQYIQSHYNLLTNSSHTNTQSYSQNIVNYQLWLVDYLSYLSSNKCIANSSVDNTCAENLGMSAELTEQHDTLEPLYATATTAPYSAIATIIDNLTQIANNLGINTEETV